MTMTAEQTTRIEKMEAELHEQRQIFIQGKNIQFLVSRWFLDNQFHVPKFCFFRNEGNTRAFIEAEKGFSWIIAAESC